MTTFEQLQERQAIRDAKNVKVKVQWYKITHPDGTNWDGTLNSCEMMKFAWGCGEIKKNGFRKIEQKYAHLYAE